ncbi:thiamine-phosphate pyrophosphorylase [Roseibium hamelinense]|uniref:Thiamine-phosphate pyrophosphorylase n=1 Tax=Roseibium hamelinense TaxID=150831 RepID=A0A562SLQ8_9HYPH|nr:thiamine-phosphate pyrophosphorylase [Roseibium hamelinense]
MNRPRLFLVTPTRFEPGKLAIELKAAFQGGDVASVLIYMPSASSKELQAAAEQLVPIIQEGGAAALIYGDTQVAGRAGADGAQIETSLEDVKLAVESLQPSRIVGAGGTKLKHEDMEWAETGIDYLFYGRLDLPEKEDPHAKTIARAQWWADLFETPCVALAGNTVRSAEIAAETGADFIAMKDAVWQHADGPASAVAAINTILEDYPFEDEN